MYKKILVPVDGSVPSMLGLAEAVKLAKSLGSTLQLVHVVNEFVMTAPGGAMINVPDVIASLREGGKVILRKAEDFVREHALEPQGVLIESLGGRTADLVLEEAKKWPADLIVIGTHGRRGLHRLALGSDAEMILRSSTVPVLMVRGKAD
jgi:nucleotide-binding universal stress UspA family protein